MEVYSVGLPYYLEFPAGDIVWQKAQHLHLQMPLNVHKECKAMASQKITIMRSSVSAVYELLFQK